MIRYISRHNKDYSRYNIIKSLLKDIKIEKNIYILLPFSKNQFLKYFFKRDKIINDFFISNYDTYVNDRKKISKYNPRAWWKFFQDWVNFRYSKYILSDTKKHFEYWESMFGKFSGKHFILPVLADKNIYYPNNTTEKNNEYISILFYGSFIPLHGIDTILRALKIVENKKIKFKAKIIGNGQTFPIMKELHKQLKLKNVQMDGNIIEEKELADEIRKFDIILGIFGKSKKASSVVPNKVYQALACQKPIITMRSKAIKEFFKETDLILCDNKSQPLANEIIKLTMYDSLRKTIALNGYQSFLNLYKKSQLDFQHFIYEMEQNI